MYLEPSVFIDRCLLSTDGLTPLMIASFCGGTCNVQRSNEDDGDLGGGSAAIITGLLSQGAAINAQTDRTGA